MIKGIVNEISTNSAISRLFVIIIGFILIIILVQITKKSFSKRIKAGNWYKTKKSVNMIGSIAFILLILVVYSDSLGSITVALGVAGAGIAFALQEVITSIAGWIAIMAGGFYKKGDRVLLGGIKGDVIDQGILRTTVMELGGWVDADLYNGRIVKIANSFVFKEPVFNYSADFPFLWDEIKIPIKFGSDYNMAREIFKRIADNVTEECVHEAQAHWNDMVRKYSIENADLNTMVTIKITDNWVEYTIRYLVTYRKRRSTQNTLFSEILNEISNSKGLVEFASTTISITDIPTIKVVERPSI